MRDKHVMSILDKLGNYARQARYVISRIDTRGFHALLPNLTSIHTACLLRMNT
jgi:hypothetical protein